MKRLPLKYRFPLLILINSLPFIFDIVFYENGAYNDLLFPIVFACLVSMNYYLLDKTLHYVLINVYVLFGVIFSGVVSTFLYYNNISSDGETLAVGEAMIFWGTAIVIVTTVISGIIKGLINRKKGEFSDV